MRWRYFLIKSAKCKSRLTAIAIVVVVRERFVYPHFVTTEHVRFQQATNCIMHLFLYVLIEQLVGKFNLSCLR